MIMPMLADVDEEKLTIAIRSLQDRLTTTPKLMPGRLLKN